VAKGTGTDKLAGLEYKCTTCGHGHPLGGLAWRCSLCGGMLDLAGFDPEFPDPSDIRRRALGLWRYAGALPLPEGEKLSMGEGDTPLVTGPAWRSSSTT